MRILVERASLHAGHPDIGEEVRDLIIRDPIVLNRLPAIFDGTDNLEYFAKARPNFSKQLHVIIGEQHSY
jgi:hypothetical protein